MKHPNVFKHVFFGGDETTKYRMINMKKKTKNSTETLTYERLFKLLHLTLMEADNKYIKSFLGVRDYVKKPSA